MLLADSSMEVSNAVALFGSDKARSGAVYLTVDNQGESRDRMVAVHATGFHRAEFHTSSEQEDGIIRMQPVPDGFVIPAKGTLVLERGGSHIMLMGPRGKMSADKDLQVELEFESAGRILVSVPVQFGLR